MLVTGGAGFIGSNFIRHVLNDRKGEYNVINMDKLTYAGNLESTADLEGRDDYSFVKGDIRDRKAVSGILSSGVDVVVNFAAESHVDRSIEDAQEFLSTNIEGTYIMLDESLKNRVELFVQISTDEVYGSLGDEGEFTEETSIKPNSPYSASKASADMFARSYYKTHGLNVIITRSSNNYGPYQFPEKVIPLFITNALEDKRLPLYGKGENVRDWIHVSDNCRGVMAVIDKGRPGEVYNIGGGNEVKNKDLTKKILHILGKPESLIKYVKDRPGHDFRYALDTSKLSRELGCDPIISVDEGLASTVEWYIENRKWWENVKSGEYKKYYERMYGERLGQ